MRATMAAVSQGETCAGVEIQHEIRKELSVIFACCFLLRESRKNNLSQEQLRLLKRIEHCAGRIRDLSRAGA
jgi:hypothetical protein